MRIFKSLFFMLCSAPLAAASDTTKQAEKEPLVIHSKYGMTCDKEKLTCVAEGEVIVIQATHEMHAKKANAFMKKNEQGKLEISRLEAYEDVQFFGLNGETATAEVAIYDLNSHRIDLKPGPGQQVVLWKDQYILLADSIDIHLKEDQNKKQEVDKIEAKGHVELSSETELVESGFATMTPKDNMIILTGDVKINRATGQLRGAYAQVNLDTKVSKVLKRSDVNSDERVKVFVYPKAVDKKTADNAPK
jgi:lipopolysaccharide export system protein LptA